MNKAVPSQTPYAAAGILARPRINTLLEEACTYPLATITAGTGYGKTRAVTSFLDTAQMPHVALQMTSTDNHPSRFWDILTYAMQGSCPDLGRVMASMGFPDTLEKSYQFNRALSEALLPFQHFVLVLDDMHKIEEPAILQFIESLVFAHLEGFTILLIGRHPLAINYSSLYNNGLLMRISIADLRFTLAETREYYKMVGLNFEEQVLQNIQASTEGWPLALYLIGLHRQNSGQLFDDPIECTIPLLYSMIEIEIFSHYDADIQHIFLLLSLPESVPLELVRMFSGERFTEVARLLRHNMFAYYNPQTGQYHFHRLFRQFLRAKRRQLPRKELNAHYYTLGRWYEEHGRSFEALRYYRKCSAHKEMWGIIRRHGINAHAELAALCLELIDELPISFTQGVPEVSVLRAHMLVVLGEIELAHRYFAEICEEYEALPPSPTHQTVLGESYIGLAHTSMIRHDYAFADYYRKANELLPEGSAILNDKTEYVGNHNALMIFENTPGSLRRMMDLLHDIRPIAAHVMNGCGYGSDYLASAEGYFLQFDLNKATEYSMQALYRGQERNQHDIVCACYFLLIRIGFAQGDYGKVSGNLAALKSYTEAARNYLYGVNDIALGWFYTKIGMPERVPRWIVELPGEIRHPAPAATGREWLVRGIYLLAKREYAQLRPLILRLEKQYEAAGAYMSRIYTAVLKSICLLRIGDEDGAFEAFAQAYDLCYTNNIIQYFVEFEKDTRDVIDMVRGRAAHGFDEAWLDTVYAKAGTYHKMRQYIKGEHEKEFDGGLSSRPSLTPREREILASLCQGLTREEIGKAYGISINTVKTLLKSIFSKLGAINRADAVRIAMDNHLLDT